MAPPSHVSLNTKTVIHCTVLHTHGCGDWKHHVQRLLKYPCSLIYCPAIPTNPTQPVVDKNVQRVQNTLASMLDRLEVEIETVEKRIGDKMHVLDRDKDGMCSAEEIAYVVQHVLTSSSTAEEAKAIAGSMDTDSDGQISVAELIAWVKKHSEQVLTYCRECRSSASRSNSNSNRINSSTWLQHTYSQWPQICHVCGLALENLVMGCKSITLVTSYVQEIVKRCNYASDIYIYTDIIS